MKTEVEIAIYAPTVLWSVKQQQFSNIFLLASTHTGSSKIFDFIQLYKSLKNSHISLSRIG